jgi:hypothetical protein
MLEDEIFNEDDEEDDKKGKDKKKKKKNPYKKPVIDNFYLRQVVAECKNALSLSEFIQAFSCVCLLGRRIAHVQARRRSASSKVFRPFFLSKTGVYGNSQSNLSR